MSRWHVRVQHPRITRPALTKGSGSGAVPDVLTPAIFEPEAGAVIEPGTGRVALTGFVAGVVLATVVSVGAGGLLAAGSAPGIVSPKAVSPGAGALVLTGHQPGLQQAVNITVARAWGRSS